jgi:hypothetical protein
MAGIQDEAGAKYQNCGGDSHPKDFKAPEGERKRFETPGNI